MTLTDEQVTERVREAHDLLGVVRGHIAKQPRDDGKPQGERPGT